MSEPMQYQDPSPIFDSFDIDLVLKVLSHTLFSKSFFPTPAQSHLPGAVTDRALSCFVGPFFTLLIPIFYFFQGMGTRSPAVVWSFAYYLLVTAFCTYKYLHRCFCYSVLIKPMKRVHQVVLAAVPKPRETAIWTCAF